MNVPINPASLSSLASEYAKNMTSIRGRRVQRLLMREFAGAEHVLLVDSASGAAVVLGFSAQGAAICATDGKGKHAAVFKWRHESTTVVETHFELLRDSLPVLGSGALSFIQLREQFQIRVPAERIPPQAGELVTKVLGMLA